MNSVNEVSVAIGWIRRSVGAVRSMMTEESFAHMERCIECIVEVARLVPQGSRFAPYRFLPQTLQYVSCMRDPFCTSLSTGELRGLTQVELYASRIIDLHGVLINVVNSEERESIREGNVKRLDDAHSQMSMRRASEVPFYPGDCMFDSVKFLLGCIGIRMTSEGVRIAAMCELRKAYAASMGDPNSEVMSLIVP